VKELFGKCRKQPFKLVFVDNTQNILFWNQKSNEMKASICLGIIVAG
jgi:hypothetical protein